MAGGGGGSRGPSSLGGRGMARGSGKEGPPAGPGDVVSGGGIEKGMFGPNDASGASAYAAGADVVMGDGGRGRGIAVAARGTRGGIGGMGTMGRPGGGGGAGGGGEDGGGGGGRSGGGGSRRGEGDGVGGVGKADCGEAGAGVATIG